MLYYTRLKTRVLSTTCTVTHVHSERLVALVSRERDHVALRANHGVVVADGGRHYAILKERQT